MGLADGFVASFNPPPIQGMSTTGGLEAYLQNRGTGNARGLLRRSAALPRSGQGAPGVCQRHQHLPRQRATGLSGSGPRKSQGTWAADQRGVRHHAGHLRRVYVNDFNRFGRTYRVQLQSEADYRAKKSDIRNVYVRSDKGEMIPLSSLVTVRDATGPELVERFNIFEAAKIMAQPAQATARVRPSPRWKRSPMRLLATTPSWSGPAPPIRRKRPQAVQAWPLVSVS